MVKMGTVWDRTAEFLSDNLPALLPVALLAFFVPASISGNFAAARQDAGPELSLSLYLAQFAFGVLSLWGSLVITAMALDMGDGRAAGPIGRARLLPALAVLIAYLVAVLLLFLPIPLTLTAAGFDMMAIARGEGAAAMGAIASTSAGSAALWFVVAYSLALCLLLLWLFARLLVITPVIVREKRMFSAFGQSWKLTRGRTLQIAGVILLYALVSWVSILAANTVFGSVFALVTGGPSEGVTLAGVLTSIVVAAVQTGFTVLAPAFAAKLYLALIAEAGLREGAARA